MYFWDRGRNNLKIPRENILIFSTTSSPSTTMSTAPPFRRTPTTSREGSRRTLTTSRGWRRRTPTTSKGEGGLYHLFNIEYNPSTHY